MLNRKNIPKAVKVNELELHRANSLRISDGIDLHYFHQQELNVVRIKLSFKAGTKFESKALVASITSDLLLEGCESLSSFQIATSFDDLGAYIDTSCTADVISITLHCLSKHVEETLSLVEKIVSTATFPQEEFDTLLAIKKQKFLVNQKKVSFVAKNEFNNFLFGDDYVYSKKVTIEDFDKIVISDVVDFYQKHIQACGFQVYVAGDVSEKTRAVLTKKFSAFKVSNTVLPTFNKSITLDNNETTLNIQLPNALQSAIRLGKSIISKAHPDFAKLYLANVILGGYFGSRLMANIREDKGYTYGIGSGIVNLEEGSYFVISTEVGAEHTSATLVEIERELDALSNELISNEELSKVKNYTLGSLLRGFDGAFAIMDRFEMLNSLGLNYEYYQKLLMDIKSISPEEIQNIAKEYLDYSSLKKIVVGKI